MAPEKPDKPKATWEFTDDSSEAYANNVFFESSTWDLKMLFGQLDQSGQLTQTDPKLKIAVHSAITVPWTQAKLMLFWLKNQIEVHELVHGAIRMPDSILPVELPPPNEETKKQDKNAEAIFAIYKRLRDELIASEKHKK